MTTLVSRLTSRLHPAWVAAFLTFLVLLTAAGVRSTPGVLLLPLKDAFGWSTATISSAVAVNILLYGLMGPFAAALMQRYGLRRMVLTALTLLFVAVTLSSKSSGMATPRQSTASSRTFTSCWPYFQLVRSRMNSRGRVLGRRVSTTRATSAGHSG